jgi:hypothetical protein
MFNAALPFSMVKGKKVRGLLYMLVINVRRQAQLI